MVFALQHQSRKRDCLFHYGVETDVTSLKAAITSVTSGGCSPQKTQVRKHIIVIVFFEIFF